MTIWKFALAAGLGLMTLETAQAAIKIETVQYKQDTAALEGLLVYDAAVKAKRPGILLAPDWMGVSDVARMQAEKTAKLGFVVFVADIYGKGVRPKDAKEAAAQSGIYKADRNLMRARAKAALDQLLKSDRVDASRIAAMGYCFGGGVALELGLTGANLAGIVAFHGSLGTPHPEDAKNIKGKVLVLHGADDPYVPMDTVRAFMAEMKQGGVNYTVTLYGGAVHAFTIPNAGNDPSKGVAYDEKADQRSWVAMQDFYREIFPTKK